MGFSRASTWGGEPRRAADFSEVPSTWSMLRFWPTRGAEGTGPSGSSRVGFWEADTGFLSFEVVVGVLTAREPRTRLGVVP